jgi:hypothetical protein
MKALLGLLTVTACGAAHPNPRAETAAPSPSSTTSATVQPVFFYVDSHGAPIGERTPAGETMQKVIPGGAPVGVLRPDGSPVTWGEFQRAKGTAKLACADGHTNVALTASGLIPSGKYTAWAVFFEAPGFDPSFAHLTGMSPLGSPMGDDNIFTADASGNAKLAVAVPASASVTVAMPGKSQAVPSCLLDTFELHLVLAYHLDGKTYGGSPGKSDVIAEQLAWPLSHGKPPGTVQ